MPDRVTAHGRARADVRVDGVSGGGEGADEGGDGVQFPHIGAGGQGYDDQQGHVAVKRDLFNHLRDDVEGE